MMRKRQNCIGLFILLLLVTTFLIGCKEGDISEKKAPNNFSELIEEEYISDLSLTIYFMSPFYLTFASLDVDELISLSEKHVFITTIDGNTLGEHTDLLNQISNADLILAENDSYMNARLYYVFENEKTGKMFDVAMWNSDGSILVNSVKVEYAEIFCDVVMPFLPEDSAEELRAYLSGEWP